MTVATVNIWAGGPLLALWIGSRVQNQGPPSMGAVAAAAVSLGVITWLLVKGIARLDAASGRPAGGSPPRGPARERRPARAGAAQHARGAPAHQAPRLRALAAGGHPHHDRRRGRGPLRGLVLLLLAVADRPALGPQPRRAAHRLSDLTPARPRALYGHDHHDHGHRDGPRRRPRLGRAARAARRAGLRRHRAAAGRA